MNTTAKRFIGLMKKEYNKLLKKLDREYDAFFAEQKNKLFIEVGINLLNNKPMFEKSDDEIELEVDKIYGEFKEPRSEELNRADDLNFLTLVCEKDGFFTKYVILKSYIEKYNFNDSEKADILAYYLNITLKHVLDFLKNHKDIIRKRAEKRVARKKGLISKALRRQLIEKEYNKELEQTKKEQGYVKHLRTIISPDGELLPFEFAKDLVWVFEKIDFELDFEDIELILSESEKRFKSIQEENAKKEQETINQRLLEEEKTKELEKQVSDRETANKERRLALQALKKYFVNDMPIKYIDEADMESILGLLKNAGYSELQIANTKKQILENNYNLTIRELNSRLNVATERYLSNEEMETLSEASSILNASESIKNGSYTKIEETYNIINGLLIEFIGNNDDNNPAYNDDAELLILYISELKEHIKNYKYSDYRNVQTLILAKKGE